MKRRILSALAVCTVLVGLCVPISIKANNDNAFRIAGEKRASAMENGESNTVVFATDHIEVTRGELLSLFIGSKRNKTSGDVIENAVQTVATRKYLYAEAVKAGYEISDSEYEAYRKQLSESLQNAENKEDIVAYFEGFGGEDSYWKIMKPTIMQNLLVRKYLNALTGNEGDETGYSTEKSLTEAAELEKIETQIRTEAYRQALSTDEKTKLMDVAAELYKELE